MEKNTGGKQFMKRKVRQLAGCLFVMALMIGVVLTKGITATATSAGNVNVTSRNALVSTGNAYSAYLVKENDTEYTVCYKKDVKFAGYWWYLISDNSTSQTSGTVTLYIQDVYDISEFDKNGNNKYSTSTVRSKLQNSLVSDKNLWAVSDAINPVIIETYSAENPNELYDRTPVGDKLWILSEDEAINLPQFARDHSGNVNGEASHKGWLRTADSEHSGSAMVINNRGELVNEMSKRVWMSVYQLNGIRPALQLDLSAVTFDSGTRTFSLKSTERKVRLSGGSNASVSGSTEQRIATGAMSTVTYTANNGFYFEPFSDIVSDGITVKRISDRQVTVSGTPTANTMITVPDARSTTLTVSFNANGGTGTMSDVHVQLYSTYKLPACTFTPPAGKEFNGWDKGAVGTTITVTADTTIVARWKKKKTASTQGAFSDYVPDDTDLTQDLLEKKVKFAEIWWYIIADNSTSKRNGTLTLLSVDPVDSGKFGKRDSDFYMDSLISEQLKMLSLHDWQYVLANTSIECDGRMRNIGQTLYLLSTEEAQNLPCGDKIRKCNKADGAVGNYWWLRSQGTGALGAAYVEGDTGKVISSGASDTQQIFGVRPVLRLDLSKVYFSTKTNTFALEPFTYNVAITGGANAARSGGTLTQTVTEGEALNAVSYTANSGFHFEPFTAFTNNGVTVTRTSDTVVTVSGTPSDNVSIAVPNAVEIPKTPSDQTATPDKTPDPTPAPGPSQEDDKKSSENADSTENNPTTSDQVQTSDSDKKKTTEVVDKKQKNAKLSKPKAGKKSFTITWKKQTAKGIVGYELQYSTDKNFKKDVKKVTINKTKTTSKTIKKLKSKKTYYVRIRTFKKVNKAKVYSKWSGKKSVKVK